MIASRPAAPAPRKLAWLHVDMDGLDALYAGRGRVYNGNPDDFYLSAVDNSLALFQEEGIRATYFLIARDLDDPSKRRAAGRIAAAGHPIASHGLRHWPLNEIGACEKREEIFASKSKIEDTLGVACQGFRAPDSSLDFESLRMLPEAGYLYDSSLLPADAVKNRLGLQRLYPEPFLMFPEYRFFELPLPHIGLGLPPWHARYAFYLTRFYFRLGLRSFRQNHNYLTLQFHLSDFATPQKLRQGLKFDILTNNFLSRASKTSFVKSLLGHVQNDFSLTTSEDFLNCWPKSAPDLNPRTILGISTTHETGACIVSDGRILSAVNEERLSRIKMDNHYPPKGSIEEAIRLAGVAPAEIDAVAIAGLHWKDLIPRTLEVLSADVRDFHAWNDWFPHCCRILFRAFYFWRATRYGRVPQYLKKTYGISPKVYYVEHQQAHAASAHRTGDSPNTFIITADGVGDDLCITFSRGEGSTIRRLESFFYPHSFGLFYTACTQILGFEATRHEGKITGLAGFGKPNPELLRKVESTLFLDDGFKLNKRYYAEGLMHLHGGTLKRLRQKEPLLKILQYRNYKRPLKRLLKGYAREDVAYTFQFLLEREMLRLARRHLSGDPVALVVAGGVMANVKLNMALSQELRPESIFVFPAMGDGGLCVGAALDVAAPEPRPLPDVYLGTNYTEQDLLSPLHKSSLPYARPECMARTVAKALADRKIVARFDGRMEFGPRALGNRSILYHCGDHSVNKWLNQQLRRTEFMPFAPICLADDAEEYFLVREGEKRTCEFMTLVVKCTEKMQETCPAAVHVDGTARPQLLRREANPDMYDILANYKELTGISCLINTSFNMHEEPIVRGPSEAITAFQQSKLDHLILGPFLVSQG